jgi:hypothetical protein
MPPLSVEPSTDLTSFSCPHCGALAHQTWSSLYPEKMSKDGHPSIPDDDWISFVRKDTNLDPQTRETFLRYAERMRAGEVFIDSTSTSSYSKRILANVWISRCYACDKLAVWIGQNLGKR